MTLAIEVEALSKRYLLGERSSYRTLAETFSVWRADRRDSAQRSELWALRDLNLSVEEGESVGLIGRNGAGKSTLLRILSRVAEPTSGVSRTRGRLGALLEVGTGFHPELTGRENIFLNGALIGMSRRETARRFDEIVEFAELQPFLNTPLKRYSTGMSLRLAFSIAAHLEPDIVVVDEVLAVADAEFRQRCVGRVSDLEREGRTLVFVSHDLGLVARLCDRAIWIDEGRIRMDGHSEDVIQNYLNEGLKARATVASRLDRVPGAAAGLQSMEIIGSDSGAIRRDQSLIVRATFAVREPVPGLDVSISVQTPGGIRILNEAWSDSAGAESSISRPGVYQLELTIPPLLASGEYVIGAWLGTEKEDYFYDVALRLTVTPLPQDQALSRPRVAQPHALWRTITAEVAGT